MRWLSRLLFSIHLVSSQTIVDTTWTDDYDMTSSGWIADTASAVITTSSSTNITYHGTYTGDSSGATFEEFNLYRAFHCTQDSSVDISYKLASCGVEIEDSITFYIDDTPKQTTLGNYTSGTTFSDEDAMTQSNCITSNDSWQQISNPHIAITSRAADTSFTVRFQIITSKDNDKWLLFDVGIACNPLDLLYTTISSSWSDDGVVVSDTSIPGWFIAPSGYITDTYHGPYNSIPTEHHIISRQFMCNHTSSVYITFSVAQCGSLEPHDVVYLYLNDVLQTGSSMQGNKINMGPFQHIELSSVANGCIDWYYKVLDDMSLNGIDLVPYNTLFKVHFELRASTNTEWWTLFDIIITCIPNPTSDPTISPSNVPTSSPAEPSIVPPTTFPTIVPSIPSTSPTILPTHSPTILPTHSPTILPTIPPTHPPSIPSITPTSFPTVFSTSNSTISTVNPTPSPTDPPTVPSGTTVDPSKGPTEKPSESPTPSRKSEGHVNDDIKTTEDAEINKSVEIAKETAISGWTIAVFVIIGCVLLLICFICIEIKRHKAIGLQIAATLKKAMDDKEIERVASLSERPVQNELNASEVTVCSPQKEVNMNQNGVGFGAMLGNLNVVNDVLMDDVIKDMKSKVILEGNVTTGGPDLDDIDAMVGHITAGFKDDHIEGIKGKQRESQAEGGGMTNTGYNEMMYDNEDNDDDVISDMVSAHRGTVFGPPNVSDEEILDDVLDEVLDEESKAPPPPQMVGGISKEQCNFVNAAEGDEEVIGSDEEILDGNTTTGM